MEHKTKAGIDWIGPSVAVTVKIVIDQISYDYFSKRGAGPEEIRGPGLKRLLPGSGFMGRGNMADMADIVDDLVPDFREHFQRLSNHDGTMGYALVHRARHTLLKNETDRFLAPEWSPFYDMVTSHVGAGREISPEDRYEAHDKVIRAQVLGKPGVYIAVGGSGDGWMYLGEGYDVGTRTRHLLNGGMFLRRVYVTGDKGVAVSLQNSLFRKVESMGLVVGSRGDPSLPTSRRGALKLVRGVDPVVELDRIVSEHYREFCRAKVGLK